VKNYWYLHENKESKWYKEAINVINAIGRKKVYNQMCFWLNREASFEGIKVASEWDYWLENPLYFKDAEPITQAEVNAIIEYIESVEEDDELSIDQSLAHYTPKVLSRRKKEEEDEEEDDDDMDFYGDWYRYYDKVFNTEHVQNVSLERMEKERYYYNIKEKSEKEKNPPAPAALEVPYVPPIIFHYETQLAYVARYVKKYENYENKMAFEGMQWGDAKREFVERVESPFYSLQKSKEYIAVTPNEDWRRGLINARTMFERTKLIEAIPAAYEEYLYLLEHKLGFEDWLPCEGTKSEDNDMIIKLKARILEGRKYLNEPENFDY